jgi:hypothetical protein
MAGIARLTCNVTLAVAVVYFFVSAGVKVAVSVWAPAGSTAPAWGE